MKRLSDKSKAVLAQTSQAVFLALAGQIGLGTALNEAEALERKVRLSAVAGILLSLGGLGVWQATGLRSPWVLAGMNSAALVASSIGQEAIKRSRHISGLNKISKDAEDKATKRRLMAAHLPELMPAKVRAGVGGDLVIALDAQGIESHCIGVVSGPTFHRIKLRLEDGVTVDRLQHLAPTIQTALGIDSPPIISAVGDGVIVDIGRSDRLFPKIDEHLTEGFRSEPVSLPMGIDMDGKLVLASPLDSSTCHFAVCGTTGSGKSELLRMWLRWLMQWPPSMAQFVVIDVKQTTFGDLEPLSQLKKIQQQSGREQAELELLFPDLAEADKFAATYSHWMPLGLIKTAAGAVKAYDWVLKEMERRYALLNAWGAKDIADYNSKQSKLGGQPLPVLFVICDEFFATTAEKWVGDAINRSLKELGAMARACGICLIISSQRISVDVMTPLIRSMLPARIVLTVLSEADSQIGSGRSDPIGAQGAFLQNKGDLMFYSSSKATRLQAPLWDGRNRPADPERYGAITVESRDLVSTAPVVLLEEATDSAVPRDSPQPAAPASAKVFEAYRAHREAGIARYKFFEANYKNASAEVIEAFEAEMAPHFAGWIKELSKGGSSPAAIVLLIWGLTEKDRAGGKKFAAAVAKVENVLRGK